MRSYRQRRAWRQAASASLGECSGQSIAVRRKRSQ